MLPGYLWQMPLYWGRCLRPVHGCCGMRLPRRFWPALPKPFGSSVVSPLPITSSPKIPNLVYTNGLDVWDSDNHRLQRPRGYLRAVAAGLLHPSPAWLPLLLSPSSLSSVPGSSRADLFGEWESTRLYLSAAEFGPASCWMTLEPFVGSTYITPVPAALSAPAWPPIRTEENLLCQCFPRSVLWGVLLMQPRCCKYYFVSLQPFILLFIMLWEQTCCTDSCSSTHRRRLLHITCWTFHKTATD